MSRFSTKLRAPVRVVVVKEEPEALGGIEAGSASPVTVNVGIPGRAKVVASSGMLERILALRSTAQRGRNRRRIDAVRLSHSKSSLGEKFAYFTID